MAHDVFISYAHEDKTTGDAACATLEARGIRCWIAPRDVLPGSIYSASIVEAIHGSRVFVLVFSSRSNTSPHVMREVERAVNSGIPILPLRIEDVPLSSSMEYFISTPHWLDALTPPLKKHLEHLAETVKLLLEKAAADADAAARPVAPAPVTQAATPTAAGPTVAPPKPPVMTAQPSPAEAAVTESRMDGPHAATSPAVHRRPVGGALESLRGLDRRFVTRAAAAVGGIGALLVIGYVAATSLNGGGQSAVVPTATASSGTPASSPGASATPILSPSPTATPSATARGASWTATADMAEGRFFHTATLLADGRVLVAGGVPGEGGDRANSLASAELYDPRTGTWTATGSMTTPRKDHAATLLDNGMVLVAGGVRSEDPFTPLASAELYDPSAGQWTVTGAMHSKPGRPTVTLLPDGDVLVVGGDPGEARYESELYDPSTGKWRAGGALPGTHSDDHTATLLADGRVLVAGGSDQQGANVAVADIYDPRTGKWTATGKMTTKRGAHTATLLGDGTVLVAGGIRTEEDPPLGSAEIFDPKSGTWSATGDLTIRRVDATATLLGDGRVLVAGGHSGTDILAASEIYDPSTGRWGIGLRMTAYSLGHTATLLADGRKVLVAGGGQGNPFAYRDAEIFDPGFGT